MDVQTYLKGRKEQIKKEAGMVKDFSVFDFSHIPSQPVMRDEAKILIDAILRYDHTGIPKNLALFGSRGSGKTLMVRYLANELHSGGVKILYCNVRNHNSSFKILEHFLKSFSKGSSFDDLFMAFRARYPGKTVVVLDEIDLMGTRDRNMDILYRLSRSRNNYMTILLSNSPRLMHKLDASTRSTLQPETVHLRNYDAEQLFAILLARAQTGLVRFQEEPLRKIAALSVRNTNSDVRVAIKTLFYTATESGLSVEHAFERATQDVVVDVVHGLNDKCLLILEGIRRTKTGLAKEAYQSYKDLSAAAGEIPFSYMHFYNNLSHLQSCGLILLISTKVDRSYTNRIRLLFDPLIAAETFRLRFR